MDKPVIDDMMVNRALHKGGWERTPQTERAMWLALEAALNPPLEPAVSVSIAMIDAGVNACEDASGFLNNSTTLSLNLFRDAIRKMFVAMERQRLREKGPGPEPAPASVSPSFVHRRADNPNLGGKPIAVRHRRYSDPIPQG